MITMVLGGTRSGKSAVAESIVAAMEASSGTPVSYLATAVVDPDDADHVARIGAHRTRRPASWVTQECGGAGELVARLRSTEGIVLIDSIGTWVTGHPDFDVNIAELLEAIRDRSEPTVIVSEEVGLAVHPPSELGRRYVDAVGTVNQALAGIADRALLVVTGRVLELGRFEPGAGIAEP